MNISWPGHAMTSVQMLALLVPIEVRQMYASMRLLER